MSDQIRRDILATIPHLRFAISEARKLGSPKLAVISEFASGGKIIASFDAALIEDIAVLIGAPDRSDKDNLKGAARQLIDHLGIKDSTS